MSILGQCNPERAEVDWDAAVSLAESLGRRTLTLVARRDSEAVREWALTIARQSIYPGTQARSASYLELAVLVGHKSPSDTEPDGEEAS